MNQELEDYFRSKIDQLEEEKQELKRKLAVICHVDIDNGEDFDWYVLHRLWDLENSLERIMAISHEYGGKEISLGYQYVLTCARHALQRSRSLK